MSGLQSHPAWQILLDNKTNKPYYYNRSANINTYTVPDDLLTPAQVSSLALVSVVPASDNFVNSKLLDGHRLQPTEAEFTSFARTTRQRHHGHLHLAGKLPLLLPPRLRSSSHLASRPTPLLANNEAPEKADPSTTVATRATTAVPSPLPLLAPNMLPVKKLRQPLPSF